MQQQQQELPMLELKGSASKKKAYIELLPLEETPDNNELPMLELAKTEPTISTSDAVGKGFLDTALGMSKFLGTPLGLPGEKARTSAMTTAQQQSEEAAKQRPVATAVGRMTPQLIGALPGIPVGMAASSAGAPLALANLTGGYTAGLPAAGSEYESRYAEVLRKTGDPELADRMALSSGLFTEAGFMLPPAIGTGLLTKVGTGAGLNVGLGEADIAIQNKMAQNAGRPEVMQEQFNPVTMGINAVLGGVAGAAGGKGSVHKVKEDFDLTPTNDIIKDRVDFGNWKALTGIENDIHATNERIHYNKQAQTKLNSEIEKLEREIATIHEKSKTSKLTDAEEDALNKKHGILQKKQEKHEIISNKIDEDDRLVIRNEKAYNQLSEKLGVSYVDPVSRAISYIKEAGKAKSTRALTRAKKSLELSVDRRQRNVSFDIEEEAPNNLMEAAKAAKTVNDTRVPKKTVSGISGGSGGSSVRGKGDLGVGTMYADTEQTLKAMRSDINPTSSDLSSMDVRLLNSSIPLLQKIRAMNNPAVTRAVNIIYNAHNKLIARRNKILGGTGSNFTPRGIFTSFKFVADNDSFQVIAAKSTKKDFYEVGEVFVIGQNRLDYDANLRMNGQHLTKHQKDLYQAIAKVYNRTWEAMNDAFSVAGKKHLIPNKMGYVPPVRKGDYAVTIKGGVSYARGFEEDAEGTRGMVFSSTQYLERFFTEKEAQDFIKKYNSLQDVSGYATSVEKIPQIENLFQHNIISRMREAAVDSGADSSVIERMDSMLREMNRVGGTIGSHHKKQMGFIEGGMGRELFGSVNDRGEAFRNSILDYVKEVTRQIEKSEIQTKIDDLLLNPAMNKFPNTKEYISDMKEYTLNTGSDEFIHAKEFKQQVDEWLTTLAHKMGKKGFHPQAHLVDTALGKTTHAFYISVLTARPSFWVAQGTAFTGAFRSLVKHQGILAANADIASGFKRFMNNDQKLFEYFMWAKNNTSSLHPEFINDLTKFGLFEKTPQWTQTLLKYITGETPSAAMDSLSRALSASFFFEHYTKKGLKGEELYTAVSRATDENMIQYGKAFKAPIYSKLGIVGDLISPLSTFSHAQLLNLANDLKHFAKNKTYQSALPAMTTMLTTFVVGGTLGVVSIPEIELLLHAVNYLLDEAGVDYQIPTIWESTLGSPTKAAFGKENKFIDKTISHGIVSSSTLALSEEGYDVGSSNRFRPIVADIITGDKSWSEIVPILPWAAQTGQAFAQALHGHDFTEGERREIARKLAPGWSFGVVDALKFDSFGEGPQPHPKNDPDLVKSKERAIARFLGTKTIEEQQFKFKRHLDKKEKARLDTEARTLVNRIALNRHLTNEDKAEIVNKLSTKYKMDADTLFSRLESTAFKAAVSYEQLPYGKGFGMPTTQELEIQDRYLGE